MSCGLYVFVGCVSCHVFVAVITLYAVFTGGCKFVTRERGVRRGPPAPRTLLGTCRTAQPCGLMASCGSFRTAGCRVFTPRISGCLSLLLLFPAAVWTLRTPALHLVMVPSSEDHLRLSFSSQLLIPSLYCSALEFPFLVSVLR